MPILLPSLFSLSLILALLVPSFFFNDTATTEIYTLSLHDALPISSTARTWIAHKGCWSAARGRRRQRDRKSTRLNSSHVEISYAVFCLKKKKKRSYSHEHKKKKHKT